jgi:hypothetical protein
MKDQAEVIVEHENDALPEATDLLDPPSEGRFKRRVDRSQEKWAPKADSLERAMEHAGTQRFDVDEDFGQFRHERLA